VLAFGCNFWLPFLDSLLSDPAGSHDAAQTNSMAVPALSILPDNDSTRLFFKFNPFLLILCRLRQRLRLLLLPHFFACFIDQRVQFLLGHTAFRKLVTNGLIYGCGPELLLIARFRSVHVFLLH
jgi:hypothetical protein